MKHLVAALCAFLFGIANVAAAAPATYMLEPDISTVGFETDFGEDHITGQMPILTADLTLDFDRISNCKVAVSLDASRAEASFPFAAQAMKSSKVLDTGNHPKISFESTSVKAVEQGAKVSGWLSIRGVRQPMVLDAQIYRQKGTEAGDLRHLTIRLTGTVLRSTYGATGWADLVGDEVRLDIRARIVRVD